MKNNTLERDFSFWRWWIRYGILKFFDRWLLLHILVGYLLAKFVPYDFSHVSSVIVIPLVGVLIGLSFAWIGNAMAILESEQIAKMAAKHPRGIKEYLYTYQSAILVLVVCIILWSLVALGIHRIQLFATLGSQVRFSGKATLYSISSLAIRECWQIVLSANWLLLSKYKVNEIQEPEKSDQP